LFCFLKDSFNKDKPPGYKNLNSSAWDNLSYEEGKKSFIKADDLSNLCIFNTPRLGGAIDGSTYF
jgi:hypothetical protein